MENNNNGHNREFADSSEEEFHFNLGTHWKDLSNSLKTIGHQLQLSSEILKNAPLPSELQFLMHTGETKKSTIIVTIFGNQNFWCYFSSKKKNLYSDPSQESILEEFSQQEIGMDLYATISDVTDVINLMLRDWPEIEKSTS